MKCIDLKVVNLNITEDNYVYKALFRLCTSDRCLDIDYENLNSDILQKIKEEFEIGDSLEQIKKIIDDKVLEATKIESRIVDGKDYNK